jgi:hypothetical protein
MGATTGRETEGTSDTIRVTAGDGGVKRVREHQVRSAAANRGVVGVLRAEEPNLLHARALARRNGWWERLFQPLTQPYVLSRSWDRDQHWSDADELAANQQALSRLIIGLLRRCRNRVYLGLNDLGESGFEQRGPLLKAVWKMQMDSQVNHGN